ncbi:hypothetical protein PG985_000664 [Apiospora marii]|uniref:Uncharacterized protein n=1 Tax=Apiospora marii TaxID=335849 RepID=A0ABR1R2L7_9PEZI
MARFTPQPTTGGGFTERRYSTNIAPSSPGKAARPANGNLTAATVPLGKGWLNPLHWAVLQRREACFRTLVEHVDAATPAGEGKGTEEESLGTRSVDEVVDAAGRTPLHLAAETGFEAAVDLLLQYGADPSARAFKVP